MPQDAKPKVKGGKPLPKWALPVGAVGVVLLVLYLKKNKAGETATSSSEQEQLNRQSFIPVTGENVAGVGASGGGSGGSSEGGNTALLEFIKSFQQENREGQQANREFERELLTSRPLTGGGAPTSEAPPGATTAPPPAGATPPAAPPPPAPAPAPPKAPSCPGGFPHLNGSSPSPHTCYQLITCGNGCQGHKYQDGHSACQTKNSKHQCVW